MEILLCSNCFNDEGLRLNASRLGLLNNEACPNCKNTQGAKLDRNALESLSFNFFVQGTMHYTPYGGSPVIQFNSYQYGSEKINVPVWLESDLSLLEETLKIGFFYYGPRMWMLGEVSPLQDLLDKNKGTEVIKRILKEYPDRIINENETVYRLRIDPEKPAEFLQYDSPPDGFGGSNRFDTTDFPVCYLSQDLEVCVHECRATVENEIFVATLQPTKPIRLLDLTEILQEDVTEFDSLDQAVHMLFSAGKDGYPITRKIAKAAKNAGFDGVFYPSYFSEFRTGAIPFETAFGISVRQFPSYHERIKSQIIPNIALFGRPLAEGLVKVKSINRLMLEKIVYEMNLGPVSVE